VGRIGWTITELSFGDRHGPVHVRLPWATRYARRPGSSDGSTSSSAIRLELMTDPANPHPKHREDRNGRVANTSDRALSYQFGVDAVQTACRHIACGRDPAPHRWTPGDRKNDDRIGRRKSQRGAKGTRDHRNDVQPSARACIPSARKRLTRCGFLTRMR